MKKPVCLLLLTATALSVAAYDDVSLVSTVALGKKASAPTGVALAEDGRVFVADGSGKVVVFGPDGAWKADWGAEKGAGKLKGPGALALGPKGDLYVADTDGNRVVVFSPEGKFRWAFGARGDLPGNLSAPGGVAVAADGSVAVADAGNKRAQFFSADGLLLDVWNVPGDKPGEPLAVAILPGRRLAVLCRGEGRVRQLGDGGVAAGEWAWAGSPARLSAIAGAPSDGLYVADEASGRIVEWGPAGEERNSFGSAGTGPGQFRTVSALAAQGGQLAVLDQKMGRVQVFRLHGNGAGDGFPAPVGRLAPARSVEIPLAAEDVAARGTDLIALTAKKILRVADLGDRPGTPVEIKGEPAWSGVRGVSGRDGGALLAEDGRGRAVAVGWDGKVSTAYGIDAKGKGRLKSVGAAAADGDGRIYVADPSAGKVSGFGPDGIPLFSAGVSDPVDVAGLPKGAAVLNGERKTLVLLDERGKTVWESTAAFVNPVSVATDLSGPQPLVYVLDEGVHRVSVWGGNRLLGQFGSSEILIRPRALTVDGAGRVWVADEKTVKGFRVSVRPAGVEGLTAKGGDGAIQLSWKPDGEGRAGSYRLEKSTRAAGGGTPVGVVPSTTTAFIDEDIVPGLTYYYTLTPAARGAADEELFGPSTRAWAWTSRAANLPPVEIAAVQLDNVFSANYKRYADTPIGVADVKNNTEQIFRNVKVGFTILDFMDFQTEQTVERLLPGDRRELNLKAVFNNKILSVSEDTPIQAQLTLTYFENGEEKTVKRTQPFRLYSRNAMDWQDPARLATFITPKDPPVLEFGRALIGVLKGPLEETRLPPELARAAAVHATLGALGITYIKDPSNPFDKARNAKAIDYVQFPRETLKRKAGDCDDLTALYASLLESLSIQTRVADLPGHVLVLMRLDAPRADTFTEDRALILEDGVWIPLETTVVGKSFEEAWREGARALRRVEGAPHTLDVRESWGVYAPATLSEAETPVLPPDGELPARVKDELAKALDVYLESAAAPLAAALADNPKDTAALLELGLLYAENERWEKSAEAFDRLLALEPDNAAALNDRANLYLIAKDAAKARELYEKAAAADAKDSGIQLNIVRAAKTAGDKTAAKAAFNKALEIAPELKKTYTTWEEASEW